MLIALGLPCAAQAADPPFDVTVCKIEGRPGCDALDGAIVVMNDSKTYWYKIDIAITCEPIPGTCEQCEMTFLYLNKVIAPQPCSSGNPCGVSAPCFLRNCPGDPNCSGCPTCDNDVCDETAQCTNVSGSVTAQAWSLDGQNWTSFQSITPILVDVATGACTVNQCSP